MADKPRYRSRDDIELPFRTGYVRGPRARIALAIVWACVAFAFSG